MSKKAYSIDKTSKASALTTDAGDHVRSISTASRVAISTLEVLGAYSAGFIEGVGSWAHIMDRRVEVVGSRNNDYTTNACS